MSTITFWSPFAGTGSTSSALIAAYAMALQYRTRILLVNTGPVGSSTEVALPPMKLGKQVRILILKRGMGCD